MEDPAPAEVPADGGARDASMRDAGARDAGMRDASMRDAGMRDTSMRDAAMRDAGARDAGMRGAGTSGAGQGGSEAVTPAPKGGRGGAPSAGTEASNAGRGGSTAGTGSSPVEPGPLDSAIAFSPAYSAYDGVHAFQVPMTVRGYAWIRWSTDRLDLVKLTELNSNTVIITTRGAGTVRIFAHAGSLSGSAVLTISPMNPEDWVRGEELYAKEVIGEIVPGPEGPVLPEDMSCRGCHGEGAQALSVEYTPQQTGGYSDEELIGIVTEGLVPSRPGWKSTIPMSLYTAVHTWPNPMSRDQLALLAYLRSLEPRIQERIDFWSP